jgi:hypothetical protein
MLGIENLKETIKITEKTVECPVKGCNEKVKRQKNHFKKESKFKCPKHSIYISPSTWEYEEETDNLLWKDECDLDLLNNIKGKNVKRESRMAHDNSEDALTWNIFRFLEKNKIICDFLKEVIGISDDDSVKDVIYWSYSQSQRGLWSCLKEGREEFETKPDKGSEPDIIILCNKSLIIIEAKLGAFNKTCLNQKIKKPEEVESNYVSGGDGWWDKVFSSDFKTLTKKGGIEKYELSRFWLIGSWIASQLNLNFYLINLTLSNKEENIENIFKKYIKKDGSKLFKRITWEQIFEYVSNNKLSGSDKEKVIDYLENKTLGYKNGNLKKAFVYSPKTGLRSEGL